MDEIAEKKKIGETVAEAMRAKGVNVEKLSQTTGISDRYLEAIVRDDKKNMPSAPYMRGYIGKIAAALALDEKALQDGYASAIAEARAAQLPRESKVRPSGVLERVTWKWVAAGLAAVAIVAIVAVRGGAFAGRPSLELSGMDGENIVAATSTFPIAGRIDPNDQLTVNGETVYPELDGAFAKEFALDSGFNTIVFRVKGVLGKETVVTKQVYYEGDKQTAGKGGKATSTGAAATSTGDASASQASTTDR